ncbi:MAG: class I SAM-dependent methyltransferase [Planctomycetota bacterium]
MKTDILGRIENLTEIFRPDTFSNILCTAVIEHFVRQDAVKVIEDCYAILRPGGALVIEAPDMQKVLNAYPSQLSLDEAIRTIYGDPDMCNDEKYGRTWMHHWGWTGTGLADEMKKAGFEIKSIVDGWTHHKTWRDFRIEAVKPVKNNWLSSHARIITSQHGEDGIIAKIFETVGTTNKFCVEFGAWDGKYNSNTWNLIHNHGWRAVHIEQEPSRVAAMIYVHGERPVRRIQAKVSTQSPNTLDEILAHSDIPGEFDFLSIDVDGTDYQIWQSLKNYSPRVVCIECCADFREGQMYIHGQDDKHIGSSLAAICALAESKGYKLVATLAVNAFFVRRELFPVFGTGEPVLSNYPLWRNQ